MLIKIKISGITPILIHRFIEEDSKTRDKNATPRETAEKYIYRDSDGKVYLPARNIYACIINAGKFHKQGKNKVTTQRSSLIPSGIMIEDQICYFDEPVTVEVDSQPVVIPSTGGRIMMHRPRLDVWAIPFTLSLDVNEFSEKFLRELIDTAGTKVGLGDFRPMCKGYNGRFVVTSWEVQDKKK